MPADEMSDYFFLVNDADAQHTYRSIGCSDSRRMQRTRPCARLRRGTAIAPPPTHQQAPAADSRSSHQDVSTTRMSHGDMKQLFFIHFFGFHSLFFVSAPTSERRLRPWHRFPTPALLLVTTQAASARHAVR